MIKLILYPLAIIYNGITTLRNFFYNHNWRKSVKFDIPVISIGNIEVGGTGKTPMSDYLIEYFKNSNYHVAVLSRGYKRKSRGFRIIGQGDSAVTAGDEPYQLYRKHGDNITVAVSKERETAIPFILAEKPETDVILLDDAFQYRVVRPSLSILLSRYDRLFYEDSLLPAGRLRENRGNVKRADLVIVTKCPANISLEERNKITGRIKQHGFKGDVFFSSISYLDPVPLFHNISFASSVILISGIAHPEPLEKHLRDQFKLLEHMQFADHHHFTEDDIERIVDLYHQHSSHEETSIIITEKDAARFLNKEIREKLEFLPVFYLPITTRILNNEKEFHDILNKSLKE